MSTNTLKIEQLEKVIAKVRLYAEDRAFHARGHLNTVNSGRIADDLFAIVGRVASISDDERPTPKLPEIQHLYRPDADHGVTFCGQYIAAADRFVPETMEESNSIPVCAPCHRRAMHFKPRGFSARRAAVVDVLLWMMDQPSYTHGGNRGMILSGFVRSCARAWGIDLSKEVADHVARRSSD